jgi:hypothetical protein
MSVTAEAALRSEYEEKISAFKKQLEELQQKSDIEARRSANAQGTVTWQLNEIWPTGGWGSLEYGTVGYTDGQVLGGRWKPMHYQFESHLYRDAVIICGDAASCLLKNDNPLKGFTGSWATEARTTCSRRARSRSWAAASWRLRAAAGTLSCSRASEMIEAP